MCGIGGIVWRRKDNIIPLVKRISEILLHRGPDDEGYLLFKKKRAILFQDINQLPKSYNEVPLTFLIHRRLSIIDLSKAGHQPMSYDNGKFWIVYNGEIYNYLELREELKSMGYSFKSNTDTEFVLAAYSRWGKECVHKFNGMWAFVILDTERNILFGSRDRFGVKPLYFSISKDFFVFSSEIKVLLALPFIKKEINPEAVLYYLMFDLEEGDEEGFIKNIYELMPSFCFEYDIENHTFKKWQYYYLSFNPEYEPFEKEKFLKYRNAVKEKIFDAVRIRLRADVPIGSCLSGGVDSSSIVCIINKLLDNNSHPYASEKKLFTASFHIKEIDESRWAHIVTKHVKGKLFQIYPDEKSLIDDLEDLIYTQEIPFGSLSIYAQYCVMRCAKEQGIKVMMDGQGADELFTGYISYYWAYIRELLKKEPACGLRELFFLKNSPLKWAQIQYAIKGIVRKGNPYLQKHLFILRYINEDLYKTYEKRIPYAAEKVRAHSADSLNSMLYSFMTGPRLKSLLRYEDRNSMRFSIEARTPFADDISLIETVFSIPSVYKIRYGWSKYLLRSSMKGIVPDVILFRKEKIGFTVPEAIWLKKLRKYFVGYLTKDLSEFINMQLLIKDWDYILKNQPDIGITGLWRFINLAIWKKLFKL